MLLDKWTNGSLIVSRQRLRVLAKDPTGGSSLADVRRAFAKLGVDLKWSPSGGDRITWTTLIDRLSHGSGAILLGDYGKLPRRYARWDPTLWTRTGPLDDHAIYLDATIRRRGGSWSWTRSPRPVGAASGSPSSALKQFAWHSGSAVWAATTPTAAAEPFAGVQLGTASAIGDAVGLHVHWPIDAAPDGWTPPTFTCRGPDRDAGHARRPGHRTSRRLPADPSSPRLASTQTERRHRRPRRRGAAPGPAGHLSGDRDADRYPVRQPGGDGGSLQPLRSRTQGRRIRRARRAAGRARNAHRHLLRGGEHRDRDLGGIDALPRARRS